MTERHVVGRAAADLRLATDPYVPLIGSLPAAASIR
jgi:hypothetical protein